MPSRSLILKKVSSDGVLLDNHVSDFTSCDGLYSCLIPLEILDCEKFAQPPKDLIMRKVGDMRRHLVVELNVWLHLLSNLIDRI